MAKRFRTVGYVPVRDDDGIRSLSNIEIDFIRQCALNKTRVLRGDGRNWNQLREQKLSLNRWENGASSTVQWGSGTRVSCSCTAELIPPNPDRPSEGLVAISVDLSPAASTSFRAAIPASTGGSSLSNHRGVPPDEEQKLTSNRILRCLERILLNGGAIDAEALCVTPDYWIWRLQLNVTVMDAGGNLLDASVLASMAALRHYRKPHVQLQSENPRAPPTLMPSDLKEPTPLPLHHTPLAITFALIPEDDSMKGITSASSRVVALIDPDAREELVATRAVLTIAMNIHGEICLLDYGGGCELQIDKLRECHKLANSSIHQLCESLEKSLEQADEQALSERLFRLQQQKYDLPPPPVSKESDDTPYYHAADYEDDYMHVERTNETDAKGAARAQTEADEAYRKQALDYNMGHVATKVRENEMHKAPPSQINSLLASMLKSLKGTENVTKEVVETSTAGSSNVDSDSKVESKAENEETVKSAELTPLVKEKKGSTKKTDIDSDEDETMQLTSEFAPLRGEEASGTVDLDDDVDDLAAAIKKKKKKPKKSKK